MPKQDGLDFGSTLHRLDDTFELHQQTVAGGAHDAALVFSDIRIDDLGAKGLERRASPGFIGRDEPRVGDDIGRDDDLRCTPSSATGFLPRPRNRLYSRI